VEYEPIPNHLFVFLVPKYGLGNFNSNMVVSGHFIILTIKLNTFYI